MALIDLIQLGSRKKPQGMMFGGAPRPAAVPPAPVMEPGGGIGGGLPGAAVAAGGMMFAGQPGGGIEPPPKASTGDLLKAGLLGFIGGPGVADIIGQRSQQEREEYLLAQRAQMKRQQERDDFVWQSEYQRAHPKAPAPNDTERDYEYIKATLGEEAAKRFLSNKTLTPPIPIKNADGTTTLYPQGSFGDTGAPAPSAAAPQPGFVEDGYEFVGGDPANPKSWRKAGGAGPAAAPRAFP